MVFSKGRAIKAIINTKGRIGTNRSLWVVISTTMSIVPRQLTKDQYPVCRKKTKQNKQTKDQNYIYTNRHNTEWKSPLSGTRVTAGLELRRAEGPMPHLKREQILII